MTNDEAREDARRILHDLMTRQIARGFRGQKDWEAFRVLYHAEYYLFWGEQDYRARQGATL
jgi:hypothetical protein